MAWDHALKLQTSHNIYLFMASLSVSCTAVTLRWVTIMTQVRNVPALHIPSLMHSSNIEVASNYNSSDVPACTFPPSCTAVT